MNFSPIRIPQAKAIREQIGYADKILDDKYLNNEYRDVRRLSFFYSLNWLHWIHTSVDNKIVFFINLRSNLGSPRLSACVLLLAGLQRGQVLWEHFTQLWALPEEAPAEDPSESQQRQVS